MLSPSKGYAVTRRAGLAVVEAILVTALVWVAAMVVSSATRSDLGFAPVVNAARVGANLTVPDGVFGGTTVAHANPGGSQTWVHATCSQGGEVVMGQWSRVDANDNVTVVLGPTPSWSSGGAECFAEEGYYTSRGRWRVQATATFSVAP